MDRATVFFSETGSNRACFLAKIETIT